MPFTVSARLRAQRYIPLITLLDTDGLCLAEWDLALADDGGLHPRHHSTLHREENLWVSRDAVRKVVGEVGLVRMRDIHELGHAAPAVECVLVVLDRLRRRHRVARRTVGVPLPHLDSDVLELARETCRLDLCYIHARVRKRVVK